MIADIQNRYLPYFVFHKNEDIYPKDFDLYLEDTRIIRGGETRVKGGCCMLPNTPFVLSGKPTERETISGELLYNKGEVSRRIDKLDRQGVDCYLEYSGERLWSLRNDTPIYNWKKEVEGGVEWTYCLFYAYQNPYSIGWDMSPLYIGGNHQADVEMVKIRLVDEKIEGIYYYEHGNGRYYRGEDIEYIDGHPLVYVSLISHASYPKPGIYRRLLGFANDKCSGLGEGHLWKPERVIDIGELEEGDLMRWYRGTLGNDGVASFGSRMDK
jgi:hypothetical protein